MAIKNVTKTQISKSCTIEQRLAKPLMTSARKFGVKKRNPITADMPGWKPVKKSSVRYTS